MNDPSWNRQSLNSLIKKLKSCLCVGLDTDPVKLPSHIEKSPEGILNFNKQIIDYTYSYAVAYKINSAFYEILGAEGWDVMNETIAHIKAQNRFAILDAKRGDIGNTAEMYASSAFDHLQADAVTVAPYMGKDSVTPFLKHPNKWTILLALTSNTGADDFQLKKLENGLYLYEQVLKTASGWGTNDQLMFVTGATRPDYIKAIRTIIPDYFLLVPGIGAQGGDLQEVMKAGYTADGDILINASRSIIYASSNLDFDIAAGDESRRIRAEMAKFI